MADQLAIELNGFPSAVRPMQAVSADAPFRSPEYLFEVKWDGLRCLLFVDGSHAVRVHDRGLNDLTESLPELSSAGRQVDGPAVLDGELVLTDHEGRPDYGALRRRLAQGAAGTASAPVSFLAFDILYLHGRSVLRQPLARRRARLGRGVAPGGQLFVPEHIETEGIELFEACLERGLEGIVAKHRDSTYVPGRRSPFWLKVKAVKSDDFVIIGTTPGDYGRPFDALLVAYYEDGQLLPCGSVAGGFDQDVVAAVAGQLEPLRVNACPLRPVPLVTAPVSWCEPELVASIRYSEWTPEGTLRFPIFNGLRPEVHPTECVRQRPRVVLAGRMAPGTPAYDLTRFPF